MKEGHKKKGRGSLIIIFSEEGIIRKLSYKSIVWLYHDELRVQGFCQSFLPLHPSIYTDIEGEKAKGVHFSICVSYHVSHKWWEIVR